MYLFHTTTLKSLKSILKDGYLKSYTVLKKDGYKMSEIFGEGYGLYEYNNFIYFSCIDKLFEKKILGNVILYFDSKILANRTFYTANLHTSEPDDLGEWVVDKTKYYKRKYNKNYRNYNNVLKKLFDYSISVLPGGVFQIFQQIAIVGKINLKELVAIEFANIRVPDTIIKYLNKYYPNIKIILSK